MSLRSRWSSGLVALVLGVGLVPPGAAVAQDGIPFRGACDLVDVAIVSSTLGVDVVTDDSAPVQYCSYQHDDTNIAGVLLDSNVALPLMRMAFPDATEITVAGHPALAGPGDGDAIPATVAVGLDDGGTVSAQVQAGWGSRTRPPPRSPSPRPCSLPEAALAAM